MEEVPSTMYFHMSEALHGAAWHERFGTAVSHGCVNLSPLDARWLFAWAPPDMPVGWHSVLPDHADLTTLWVSVEKAAPPFFPPLVSSLVAR